MDKWNEVEIQNMLAEVMKRASTDPEYRALSLSDPVAAVAQVNPRPLPPGFKLRFVDNAGANLTIVLPDAVAASGELSDSELAQVAGRFIRPSITATRCCELY